MNLLLVLTNNDDDSLEHLLMTWWGVLLVLGCAGVLGCLLWMQGCDKEIQ